MLKKILILLVIFAFSIPSLPVMAARTPSVKGAHGTVQSYFKRYGNKYKDSIFGTSKVERVEIGSIEEQSKNLAQVEAMVSMSSGQKTHMLVTFKKTPPLGWKVKSWEMLEVR